MYTIFFRNSKRSLNFPVIAVVVNGSNYSPILVLSSRPVVARLSYRLSVASLSEERLGIPAALAAVPENWR